MTAFLVIGAVGVALLLVAIVIGDHLEGALQFGGDLFSTEAVAGFLGALGFVGALTYDLTGSVGAGVVTGAISGVALGLLAGWVSSKLRRGGDESNVRPADLTGRTGNVISPIPAEGYGEVSIVMAGHLIKLHARSSAPVPAGTTVTVTGVLSPTSVLVEPLWLP